MNTSTRLRPSAHDLRRLAVEACRHTKTVRAWYAAPDRDPHRLGTQSLPRRSAKRTAPPAEDAMERYDWSRARRGYWAGKLRRGNTRTLEPDVAEAFPDDDSVNTALRAVLEAAKVVRRAD